MKCENCNKEIESGMWCTTKCWAEYEKKSSSSIKNTSCEVKNG